MRTEGPGRRLSSSSLQFAPISCAAALEEEEEEEEEEVPIEY
jgi:hypothetical protein